MFRPCYPDGRTRFTVDRCGTLYRLWFEGYGRYVVAADGSEVACQREGVGRAWRERFLFAQALPLAAILRGFDLLHASAVCGKRGVAAFVAPSGLGKTTLASRLVVRGAGFMTDDALALSPWPGGPLAHPGAPFMAVPHGDRGMLTQPAARAALSPSGTTSDKLHAYPRTGVQALPLLAVFYLERARRLRLTELEDVGPTRLLASVLAPYVGSAERLACRLEVAHQVSCHVRQYLLQLPAGSDSRPTLEAVEARLQELRL